MKRKVLRAYRTMTKAFHAQAMHRCLRCDHTWKARQGSRPQKCPGCGSRVWDQPRVRWAWSSSYRHAIDQRQPKATKASSAASASDQLNPTGAL
jgi:DNA-directed RNA polymerase subunit RPC12/RpoP